MKLTKESLIENVKAIKRELGKIPRMNEWSRYGFCHIKTVRKICQKSWREFMIEIFGQDEYEGQFMIEVKCQHCNKIFKTERHKKRVFCSQSCSATLNNQHYPKRQVEGNCKFCGIKITSQRSYCKKCWKEGKNYIGQKPIEERTLRDLAIFPGMARYNKVRLHARLITRNREQKCIKCGYDKHVQTCHVKSVSEFSLDSTLKEINSPSNLVLLCPNCHWEFDHGLLDISTITKNGATGAD